MRRAYHHSNHQNKAIQPGDREPRPQKCPNKPYAVPLHTFMAAGRCGTAERTSYRIAHFSLAINRPSCQTPPTAQYTDISVIEYSVPSQLPTWEIKLIELDPDLGSGTY
jgi:hypothetical protein